VTVVPAMSVEVSSAGLAMLLLLPGKLNSCGKPVELFSGERASWAGPKSPEGVVGVWESGLDEKISLSGLKDGGEVKPNGEDSLSQLLRSDFFPSGEVVELQESPTDGRDLGNGVQFGLGAGRSPSRFGGVDGG